MPCDAHSSAPLRFRLEFAWAYGNRQFTIRTILRLRLQAKQEEPGGWAKILGAVFRRLLLSRAALIAENLALLLR